MTKPLEKLPAFDLVELEALDVLRREVRAEADAACSVTSGMSPAAQEAAARKLAVARAKVSSAVASLKLVLTPDVP